MIYPSVESVQDFITDLIDAKSYEKPEVTVSLHDNVYSIHIKQMYEYVAVNFRFLSAISQYFNTDNIHDERYSRDGCETCDYGSSYEVTITVKE